MTTDVWVVSAFNGLHHVRSMVNEPLAGYVHLHGKRLTERRQVHFIWVFQKFSASGQYFDSIKCCDELLGFF